MIDKLDLKIKCFLIINFALDEYIVEFCTMLNGSSDIVFRMPDNRNG